jgi:predicted aldo/keto reductase-like oxidoreductase
MKKREFIKKSALSTGAIVTGNMLNLQLTGCQVRTEGSRSNAARLPRRRYGKTGIELSIIGFGGMMLREMDQDAVNHLVAESIERGVCYFDFAPTYGDAEAKLGPPLEPHRQNVFLACKTTQRGREGAAQELKQSLKTLRTDYLDLYQLHAITDVAKDVDAVFSRDGAMEVFIEAKKAGVIRHIGFSAHSEEAALAAMERYNFDSAMFPVNFCCYFNSDFGPKVVNKAQSKGVAILAIKSMAQKTWTRVDSSQSTCDGWYENLSDEQKTDLAMRFALSHVPLGTGFGEQL